MIFYGTKYLSESPLMCPVARSIYISITEYMFCDTIFSVLSKFCFSKFDILTVT